MKRARRVKIEVRRLRYGGYLVRCTPVAYLGKREFRTFAKTCESYFMSLVEKWVWAREFSDRRDAEELAEALCREFEELFYRDLDVTRLVAPRNLTSEGKT